MTSPYDNISNDRYELFPKISEGGTLERNGSLSNEVVTTSQFPPGEGDTVFDSFS